MLFEFPALKQLIAVHYIPHPVVAAGNRIGIEKSDYSSEVDYASYRKDDQNNERYHDDNGKRKQ